LRKIDLRKPFSAMLESKSKTDIHVKSSGTIYEKFQQSELAYRIEAIFNALGTVNCDGAVKVVVEKGRHSVETNFVVYGEESHRVLESAIDIVEDLSARLAAKFPRASVTVDLKQSMERTPIARGASGVH
jgi:hypothetical protein